MVDWMVGKSKVSLDSCSFKLVLMEQSRDDLHCFVALLEYFAEMIFAVLVRSEELLDLVPGVLASNLALASFLQIRLLSWSLGSGTCCSSGDGYIILVELLDHRNFTHDFQAFVDHLLPASALPMVPPEVLTSHSKLRIHQPFHCFQFRRVSGPQALISKAASTPLGSLGFHFNSRNLSSLQYFINYRNWIQKDYMQGDNY